ncbi:hypothetical protein, partial [Nocardia noduli]|uniref:hypothetical protein n=1 Tax=Nocardia noduli TaxID=2815722 RepID=UPI001C210A15
TRPGHAMTYLAITPDHVGPHEARFTRLSTDSRIPTLTNTARFRSPWIARAWLYDAAAAASHRHSHTWQYHARISNGIGAPALYELTGTGADIAVQLALLERTGIDDTHVTAFAPFSERLAFDLIENYRSIVTDLVTVRAYDPTGDRARQLHHHRQELRHDIHAIALASAPLSQPAHLHLAQALLEIDTHALATPEHSPLFTAVFQDLDPGLAAPGTVGAPVEQAFDSMSHAREWLISMTALTHIRSQQIVSSGAVAMAVFDQDSNVAFRCRGPVAEIGMALHDISRASDEQFLTGIAQIDHLAMYRRVEAYEMFTDYLINALNTDNGPDENRSQPSPANSALAIHQTLRAGVESRARTAAPAERMLALRRVSTANKRLMTDRDHLYLAAAVASSGFIAADLEVALSHLTLLARHDSSEGRPSAEETQHRLSELSERIDALLLAPHLSDIDRDMIADEVIGVTIQPHLPPHRARLYPWPSLEALDARTTQVTAHPVRPGERGFSDALHLHHLTQIMAADSYTDQAGRSTRRIQLAQLLSRQRDHLQHSVLTAGLPRTTMRQLTDSLTHRPLSPIPNHHAVAEPTAIPAHTAPEPSWAVLNEDYMLCLVDPSQAEREVFFGYEAGRWVARSHQRYPAYSTLRIEEGVADFDSAQHLLDALETGLTCTDHNGQHHAIPAVTVPEPARAALHRLQKITDDRRAAEPPATAPRPSATTTPWTAAARRTSAQRRPPPAPGPARRL